MEKRVPLVTVTIHDCRVDTFRSGGAGGQNQNKRDTGVRVVHVPSGAVGESREERSQLQNKKRAFRRMAESKEFHNWLRVRMGHEAVMTANVERAMQPENIRVEVQVEGRWTCYDANGLLRGMDRIARRDQPAEGGKHGDTGDH